MPTRRSNVVLINRKRSTSQVKFGVSAVHTVKINENETIYKYLSES